MNGNQVSSIGAFETGGSALDGRVPTDEGAAEFTRYCRPDETGEVELLCGRYKEHRFVPHTHETYSIGVIIQGALRYDYRRAVFTASPGAISIIEPGEVHTGYAGEEWGWRYRNFFLGADLMRRVARAMTSQRGLPHFDPPVILDRPLAARMLRLHYAMEAGGRGLGQESELFEVLGRLLGRHSNHRPEPGPTLDHPAVVRACEFLRDTLDEKVSLEAVAAVAGYSPYHFLRVFRRHVGLTPHGYQLRARIRRARRLLDGSGSLADIALECGFADQSHLTRRFKQVLGFTPGQYVQGRGRRPGGL